MRLYIKAETGNTIAYTPDKIRLTLVNGDEITFDIRGSIDYSPVMLNCRVKGDLVPWVHRVYGGTEELLYELDEESVKRIWPVEKIIAAFNMAVVFEIGLAPLFSEETSVALEDVFVNKKARLEIDSANVEYVKEFTFDVEITEG